MNPFSAIVLAIITPLMIWSIFSVSCLWDKRKRVIGCLYFALQDIFIVWMLIFPIGALYDADMKTLLFLVILLASQLVYNLIISAVLLVRGVICRIQSIPFDKSRRDFLKNTFCFPALVGSLSIYGSFMENHRDHVLNEIQLFVKGLTAPDGYKLLQLSDMHLGHFFSLDDLNELLTQASQQGASLLAITGDLFDSDTETNHKAALLLNSFARYFPDGIYLVLGNHEHRQDLNKLRVTLSALDIHLFEDMAMKVPGKELWIAGVDYPMNKDRFEEERKNHHRQAMSLVPDGVTTILLGHHPECIDDGAASGAALTLTGHTHGCQFGIFGRAIFPIFRYNRGLVKTGDCYGYVHSGNGSWFPCRIGCPPEIAVFTLRSCK